MEFYLLDFSIIKEYEDTSSDTLRRIADRGNLNAITTYGCRLQYGYVDLNIDHNLALEYLERAANANTPEAIFFLAQAYYEGNLKTSQEILELLSKASEMGVVQAMHCIGLSYFNGNILTEKNYNIAMHWFKMSAEQNHAPSQYRLALIYEEGLDGNKPNIDYAIYWYERAAESGHSNSLCMLGYLYETGIGCTQDFGKALDCYKLAIDNGSIPGLHNLGVMYLNGYGVDVDSSIALEYISKAAEFEYPPSVMFMYHFYTDGILYDIDNEKAEYWLNIALKYDSPEALVIIAKRYIYGNDIEKHKLGIELLEKASKNGDASALVELGISYVYGVGTDKDEAAGFKCFDKAVKILPGLVYRQYALYYQELFFSYYREYYRDKYYSRIPGVTLFYSIRRNYKMRKVLKKILEYYQLAYENNDMQAKAYLGDFYAFILFRCNIDNLKVRLNKSKLTYDNIASLAIDTYYASYNDGNILSLYNIAGIYKDFYENIPEAYRLYLLGADKGDYHSCLAIGNLYSMGYNFDEIATTENSTLPDKQCQQDGVYSGDSNIDIESVMYWYNRALKSGKGSIYFHVIDFIVSRRLYKYYDQALDCLNKVIDMSHAHGYAYMGSMYADINWEFHDVAKAKEYFLIGASFDDFDCKYSLFLLADSYFDSIYWLIKSIQTFNEKAFIALYEQVYVIFNKANDAKDEANCIKYANLALTILDLVLEKEYIIDNYYFALAAALKGRLFFYGLNYQDVPVININYDIAEEYYRLSISYDYSGGYSGYGAVLVERYNSKKKHKEAFELFVKAANLGDLFGMYNLGKCYLDGIGVDKDYDEALKWFRTASESDSDDTLSKGAIAICYIEGKGVEKDIDKGESILKEVLEVSGFDADIYYAYGVIMYDKKNYTEAYKYLLPVYNKSLSNRRIRDRFKNLELMLDGIKGNIGKEMLELINSGNDEIDSGSLYTESLEDFTRGIRLAISEMDDIDKESMDIINIIFS